MTGDWLRIHESVGELDLAGPESSSTAIFLSTLIGSVAINAVPSSERLSTDGAVALSGERTSSNESTTVSSASGESLQCAVRS